ncbi:hypothetical protein V0242_06375 [Aeromonas hydrophila]|uniref:hypothetical protein n=1 Tax=Aeromonas hydrophila TaxID=644 RepID=UPI002ED26F08|nr:hypothetical protein V0242_06375 [Aeromonas hydrophila]
MAKHITIKVPGKHPQTGELTTFELKGQRIDIDIGGQAVPFLIHGRGISTSSPTSRAVIALLYSAAGSPLVTPYLRISPAERPAPRWP